MHAHGSCQQDTHGLAKGFKLQFLELQLPMHSLQFIEQALSFVSTALLFSHKLGCVAVDDGSMGFAWRRWRDLRGGRHNWRGGRCGCLLLVVKMRNR